jgi:hypothetical protein
MLSIKRSVRANVKIFSLCIMKLSKNLTFWGIIRNIMNRSAVQIWGLRHPPPLMLIWYPFSWDCPCKWHVLLCLEGPFLGRLCSPRTSITRKAMLLWSIATVISCYCDLLLIWSIANVINCFCDHVEMVHDVTLSFFRRTTHPRLFMKGLKLYQWYCWRDVYSTNCYNDPTLGPGRSINGVAFYYGVNVKSRPDWTIEISLLVEKGPI